MENIAVVDDDHAFSLPSLLDELPRKLPHDFLHHLIRAAAANEIAKETEAEGEFALPVRIFVFEHLCNELLVPSLLIKAAVVLRLRDEETPIVAALGTHTHASGIIRDPLL